eukprot:200448-Amphidinium_carterae.6
MSTVTATSMISPVLDSRSQPHNVEIVSSSSTDLEPGPLATPGTDPLAVPLPLTAPLAVGCSLATPLAAPVGTVVSEMGSGNSPLSLDNCTCSGVNAAHAAKSGSEFTFCLNLMHPFEC